MDETLLATKLYIPAPRPGPAVRARLLGKLDEAAWSGSRLILITAPAGYGKTTLLAEWARRQPGAAWLTLGEGENDPARFYAYLTAAIHTVFSATNADHLLAAGAAQPPVQRMTALINALARSTSPVTIILDDYHSIETGEIHEAVAFLAENLPPQALLVIAGRADPPLPLAKLRGRGQLTEIRLNDLRFSDEEARAFLAALGIPLNTADLTALNARAEGWAAGLQMAAASMHGRQDLAAFIRSFTGSHRYILDYLAEEALKRQPEYIQNFLIETSILEQLCAELCNAVTLRVDSRAIINELERANLFILPLDDQREWYRYHRLFADLLRQRLLQRSSRPGADAEQIAALHQRASLWHEQNGIPEAAIFHALKAGDSLRAAGLIEAAAEATLMRSELTTFRNWINALPETEIVQHPALNIYRIWSLLWSGESLASLERGLAAAPGAASLRAFLALFKLRFQEAEALLRQTEDPRPQDTGLLTALDRFIRATLIVSEGEVETGLTILEETARVSRQTGNVLVGVLALCVLAETRQKQGRLQWAEQFYRQAQELAIDPAGRQLPIAGKAIAGHGQLAFLRGEVDQAVDLLRESIALTERWSEFDVFDACTLLAMTALFHRDWAAAEQYVQRCRLLAQRFDITAVDDAMVDLVEMRLRLEQGRLAEVRRWASAHHLSDQLSAIQEQGLDGLDETRLRKYEYLLLIRLLLIEGRWQAAQRIAVHLLEVTQKIDRPLLWLETSILTALASHAGGETERALEHLQAALAAAAPEGIAIYFLAEGKTVADLLAKARERIKDPVVAAFADRLLASGALQTTGGQSPSRAAASDDLPQPLSEREMEVLRLIAKGRTNQEIAAALFLTLRTVKFHTGNILAKLAASNRTEAVILARRCGLLPKD